MMQSASRVATAMLVACVTLLLAPDARAGEFGFSVGTDLSAINVVSGASFSDLGTRIGYRQRRVMPFATFDYARLEFGEDFNSPNFESTRTAIRLMTLGLGGRFWLQDPEPESVAPYVVATGFTALPNLAGEGEGEEVPGRGSSWGALAGFGADYTVGPGFAVGGELGATGFFANLSTSTSSIDVSLLQFYTGIELSFYPWAGD